MKFVLLTLCLEEMSDESVKIAVLEQKLLDFANFVSKIDDAISKLSDVNSNISKMLAVHEERIEQCNKSDNLIIKMIDDLKDENSKEHSLVSHRMSDIENEIKEIKKIKWMTIGCGVILAILATSISTLASGWWTPAGMQEHNKITNQYSK